MQLQLLLVMFLSSAWRVTSDCQSDFRQELCSLGDQTCALKLQTQISSLVNLKSSTLQTAFKYSFDVVVGFNNPYICTDPTRYSTYIRYDTPLTPIAANNCSAVPTWTTCDWEYREGVYETQLVAMRLLNEYNNKTKAFVQKILNYSGDPTVTCYNPHGNGQFDSDIDSTFSGVDLTTLADYYEQNSRLVNTLVESLSVLNSCLTNELQNQNRLQLVKNADDARRTTLLVAFIAAASSILVLLLSALGWVIKQRYCRPQPQLLADQENLLGASS